MTSLRRHVAARICVTIQPGCLEQSVAPQTEELNVPGSLPGPAHTFVEIDHEIISTIISPVPPI